MRILNCVFNPSALEIGFTGRYDQWNHANLPLDHYFPDLLCAFARDRRHRSMHEKFRSHGKESPRRVAKQSPRCSIRPRRVLRDPNCSAHSSNRLAEIPPSSTSSPHTKARLDPNRDNFIFTRLRRRIRLNMSREDIPNLAEL